MNIEIVNVTTESQLDNLGSALTIEGLANESFKKFANWINERAGFKSDTVKCYVTSGSTMNDIYGLTGDNAYPSDLNIVSFDLNDMKDYEKIVTKRFEVEARWLDDIIANNIACEEENDEDYDEEDCF